MEKKCWRIRISGLYLCSLLVVSGCIVLMGQSSAVAAAEELSLPDDFKVSEYFSFFGSGGINWQALNDPNNNPILVACLKGVADESFKPLGVRDLQQRLERLERGGLIKKAEGRYTLAFPAVVGAKRDQLQKYAEQAALQLVPFGEKMIAQIRTHLAGHDEMVYHVLWSVVMDGGPAWDAARAEMKKRVNAGDTSTENKAWLLYPSHPFQVGTNGYNTAYGHLAITWSRNTPSPNAIGSIISRNINQLSQAIEQNRAVEPANVKDALDKYGLVDEAGKVRFYAVKSDSQAAQSYAELGAQFGREMMAYLDVKIVAEMLEVSPGIAFVIACHEICWQLLHDLVEKKVLEVPLIIAKGGIDTNKAYQLVSLTLMQSVPTAGSGSPPAKETQTSDQSTGNRVLSLDGQVDCMRVADSQSLRSFSEAITIEVWLKAVSFAAEDGDINSIIRKNVMPGAENFLLRFRNMDGSPCAQMGLGEIGTLSAPSDFAVNKWFHLAGTYDGRTITVLVNGLAIASQNVSGRLRIDPSDLYIGKGDPTFSFGEYFHGELDEIRIWNVARSQEQIRSALNAPLTGKEAGMVAYWNFDDGTAKDMSGHGNDGILTADARIIEASRPTSVVPQERQPGKLVAWWKLDEADGNDVGDSSGNGRAGRRVGNPQWRPGGGKVGGALAFDGTGDFVQIADEPAFDLAGPITVSAWIKVNSFDKRWQAIVTKGDSAWRLQRFVEEDTLAFHCTGIASVTGQRPEGIEGKKNVNDGQWHHVVGVYDGATIGLYIDGVLDNSSKASGVAQMNDLPVVIGANSEQTGREWNGMIDEVCIISGAIDADAVHALYTGTNPLVVAQTAKLQLQGPSTGDHRGIEGDWEMIIAEIGGSFIVRISQTPAGSLTAISMGTPLDKITFDSGKLHFEGGSPLCVFDGTLKEDGLTIEGQLRQKDQQWPALLKRDVALPSEVAPVAREQPQSRGKLVSWWKFENDPNDSAGAIDGTLHGNPAYVNGKVGRAISFDGDDYVDLGKPDSLKFGTGDWTISAWIKTTQSGTDPANRGTVFAYGGDEAGGIRYTLAVNEEYLGTTVLTTDNDTYKVQAFGKTTVNNGNWHHVVGMRNADQLRVYVDGVLDGDTSLPAGYDLSGVSQHNAYIGVITDHRDNSLFKYFVGLIDEVCIFGGAIDANGVRSLYAGGDPVKVAQTAIIAGAAPQPPPRPVTGAGAGGGIEGDWEIVSSQVGQKAVIPIRRNSDGALTATIVIESTDVAAPTIPLDEVTFQNGKLHFKGGSPPGVFEGTMKEDGLTIEGQYQQQGQTMALALKRVVAPVREPAPASPEQLQGQTSGTGRVVTAVILVLVLAGVVAAIVLFLVKSSISR